ncbi:hypothetical protein IWQ56_000508, partial [Coemansia nantahalensis]
RSVVSPVPAPTQLHMATPPVRSSLDARAAGLATPPRHATPEPADLAAARAAESSPAAPWTLDRVLTWLAGPFGRATASRELRAGIVDAYTAFSEELAGEAVAAHYAELAAHVLGGLAQQPQQRVQGQADVDEAQRHAGELAVRGMCARVLRALARRLPDAAARRSAAECLGDGWLRGAALRQSPAGVAVVALGEWRTLVGESGPDDSAWAVDVAVPWLDSPSEAVRVAAAAALGAAVRAAPIQRARVVASLAERLQTLSAHCAAAPGDMAAIQSCLGCAMGVAAALGSGGDGLLEVPLDLAEWVHSVAVRLVDAAHGRTDPAVVREEDPASDVSRAGPGPVALRDMRGTCGWALLAGLAGLGGEFARPRAAQWLRLWAQALPDGGLVTGEMPWAERMRLLRGRVQALEHIRATLVSARAALDGGAASRLVGCMRATLMFADNALDAPRPPHSAPAALVALHLAVRARVAECLRLIHVAGWGVAAAVPAVLRLAEQALASPDSLPETFAAQCLGAIPPPPREDGEPLPPCLRGFRAGPWGYEAEVGVTSLLGSGDDDEGDFAACVIEVPERDWAQAVLHAPPSRVVAPYTQLVDAAARLFGALFGTLGEEAQVAQVAQLVSRLNGLPFNSHRHSAILTNALVALREALRQSNGGSVAPRVAAAVADAAYTALLVPAPEHRAAAGEVVGLLAARVRDASHIPRLLERATQQAIRGRDRFARAGAAVALGALFARAGAIAAGGALKQVVVLLHSLACDRDPVVHTCAIRALADAATAAGYMFAPYARDTLLMARKLFLSDSHTAPLHASALWLRGRDHAPGAPADVTGHERALPVRTPADPYAWVRDLRQQQQQSQSQPGESKAAAGLGGIVAAGRDAAITHPNSATHNGRGLDDQRDVPADGDYLFACTCADVDACDARAALGQLIGALIEAFGPDLHDDAEARATLVPLVRELRRALDAVVSAAPLLLADPDAHWRAGAEYTAVTQRQLLFFAPRDAAFLPAVVRSSLRPVLRARRVVYHGHAAGLRPLQRAATRALENILRLSGPRVELALRAGDPDAHWPVREIVWEALCLLSDLDPAGAAALAPDIRALVRTAVGLVVAGAPADDAAPAQILALVATLCAVFTRPPVPESVDADGSTATSQFGAAPRLVALAALLAVVRAADRVRGPAGPAEWRAHALLPALPDLLHVAYVAATAACPDARCLGLHVMRRVVASFADVEDPAVPGVSALDIYQAQVTSALGAALADGAGNVDVRCAAIGAATACVEAGLASDQTSLVRILRLLAPQPAFAALVDAGLRPAADSVAPAPQQQLVERLALLHAWARILDHASARDPRLLGAVRIHVPLLPQMWLACARDACVIGVSPRDAYEELDAAPAAQLDAGLGLQLGLEATYVGLVRASLLPWYRVYAPAAIRALAALVVAPAGAPGALAEGRDCLLDLVAGYDCVRLAGESAPERQPSQAAVLLLCAILQELARGETTASDDDQPLPGAPGRLVAELDVCAREPAADADADAQRAAHSTRLIQALGELLRRGDSLHLTPVFAAAAPAARGSWLAEELWRHGVSTPLRAFVAAPESPAAATTAGAALDTAAALIRALAQQCLFGADADPDALAAGDLCRALGLSPFGAAVVRDAAAAWQAARATRPALATGALRVLALIIAMAPGGCDDAPLAALWLSMWRQTLAPSADPQIAAASLAEFVRLAAAASPADILTGDAAPRGEQAAAMASALLAQLLAQDDARAGIVPVVASLLATGAFAVPPAVCARFVAAYPVCLAVWDAPEAPALLAVPGVLAAASPGSADVAAAMAALARGSIPVLAARVYAQLDAAQAQGGGAVDGGPLAALVQFAAADYGVAAAVGAPVAAAVLMVLLSMLPEDRPLAACEAPLTEAVIALAAARPLVFRDIVVRLSAAHASARKRLELAVRSHAPADAAAAAGANGAARTHARKAGAKDSARIVLKSDFGI